MDIKGQDGWCNGLWVKIISPQRMTEPNQNWHVGSVTQCSLSTAFNEQRIWLQLPAINMQLQYQSQRPQVNVEERVPCNSTSAIELHELSTRLSAAILKILFIYSYFFIKTTLQQQLFLCLTLTNSSISGSLSWPTLADMIPGCAVTLFLVLK